ncbi:GNAT family N-acetyltransferase [Vulcaniibacterium tengchongense]|uniref:Putative N-acetyltransferase YhbS n=1 Tax=Vulcaniibacterium tengchongense TaxID=1273429 RepID=A0A3N4V813_9GAMM|nr:GNAT family N-acetyltransferase [Vulcaniibacterium tengchongense]RPE75831.1 putative N-acetyltransferase YhbS [Vulcaniibacterium tengchongense]
MSRAYALRPGRADEAAALIGIERRACELLRGHEAHAAFSRHTLAPEDHAEAAAHGRLWVADCAGRALGYALYAPLDGAAHLAQMDVDPGYGRRGIGRALLEQVCVRAAEEGFDRITLITLRDVPWNAPFYARAGFAPLAPGECTPGLRAAFEQERRLGFPMHLRVAMQRPLGRPVRPAG